MQTVSRSSLINHFRYRPEVDGLRAIAVLAVVFYHAGLGVPGGFVGVDVFFVISGYLISSIILREMQEGRFSLLTFWERRARRIIPAVVVLVVCTVAAGYFILLPYNFNDLAWSAVFQSFFAANFYFWQTTHYFAGPAEEQALLHTWSLAVEEQFYFVFPFLLLGLLAIPVFRRRLGLILVFSGISLLSLIYASWLLPHDPDASFYLLPSRTWELLLGAIIALVPAPSGAKRWRPWLSLLAWLGMAGIVIPCFVYAAGTPFPGYSALPVCLGTAAFVWATHRRDESAPMCSAARLMALRPLVFIGLVSYSFYLWHWPFIAFSNYWEIEPHGIGYRLMMVALGFIFAVLSWKWVETPFRKRRWATAPGPMLSYAGIGVLASALFAWLLIQSGVQAQRFSETVRGYSMTQMEARPENRITQSIPVRDALAGRFPRLGHPSPAPVQAVVWGDSHARSILPGLRHLAFETDSAVHAAWYSGTPPVIGYIPPSPFSLMGDAPRFAYALIDHVNERGIPHVVLAARWSYYFNNNDPYYAGSTDAETFARDLLFTLDELRDKTEAQVWIVREVPTHFRNPLRVLAANELSGLDLAPYQPTAQDHLQLNAWFDELLPELEARGARLIDTAPILFDASEGRYRMAYEQRALYYDSNHFSTFGAIFVSEAFREIFGALENPQ